jgi:hypothetical protein
VTKITPLLEGPELAGGRLTARLANVLGRLIGRLRSMRVLPLSLRERRHNRTWPHSHFVPEAAVSSCNNAGVQKSDLLYHIVGAHEDLRRNCYSYCFGSFQIEN